MTIPDDSLAAAFLVEPKNKPLAQGERRALHFVSKRPLVGILLLLVAGGALCVRALSDTGAPDQSLLYSGGTLVLLAAAWAAASGRGLLRGLRLGRYGRLIPGEVIFCAGTRTEEGELVVNMKYRFQPPAGNPIEAVERFGGRRLPGEALPSPRTALAIYYASEDCYTVL